MNDEIKDKVKGAAKWSVTPMDMRRPKNWAVWLIIVTTVFLVTLAILDA